LHTVYDFSGQGIKPRPVLYCPDYGSHLRLLLWRGLVTLAEVGEGEVKKVRQIEPRPERKLFSEGLRREVIHYDT
jgi:hypothetical protein